MQRHYFSGYTISIRFLLFFSALFCFSALRAQSPANGKYDSLKAVYPQKINYLIKFNPTAMLIGVMPFYTAEYRLIMEFPSAQMQSSQVGISYLGKGPILWFIEQDTLRKNPYANNQRQYITGFRAQASYKFFINKWLKKAGVTSNLWYSPFGIYISPHISYSSVRITNRYANQYGIFLLINHFNVNLLGGCQIRLTKKLSADLFAGLGYKKNRWFKYVQNKVTPIPPDEEIPFYFSPVKFSLGMNFGYCF